MPKKRDAVNVLLGSTGTHCIFRSSLRDKDLTVDPRRVLSGNGSVSI